MLLAIGTLGFPEILVIFFVLAFLGLWLWMLIDCLLNESDSTNKIVWTLVIIFVNGLGALLYFLFRFLPRKRAEQGAEANGHICSVSDIPTSRLSHKGNF